MLLVLRLTIIGLSLSGIRNCLAIILRVASRRREKGRKQTRDITRKMIPTEEK